MIRCSRDSTIRRYTAFLSRRRGRRGREQAEPQNCSDVVVSDTTEPGSVVLHEPHRRPARRRRTRVRSCVRPWTGRRSSTSS